VNNHDKRDDGTTAGVDDDRTEGSIKRIGGEMKEGAGKLFGDAKMKHEGQADQAEGTAQNFWGSAKDEVREAIRENRDDQES